MTVHVATLHSTHVLSPSLCWSRVQARILLPGFTRLQSWFWPLLSSHGGLEFSSRVLFRLWGWDPWLLGAARHSSHLEDEMVGWHHQLSGHEFENRVLSCSLVSSRPRASSCSFQGSFNGLPDSALIRGFSYVCSSLFHHRITFYN